jgi:hypothetical protein
MKSNQRIWQDWARNLHQWGVSDWAAALLESAGLLSVLGAQLLYMSHPFARAVFSEDTLSALSGLLEDPSQARAFACYLREGNLL